MPNQKLPEMSQAVPASNTSRIPKCVQSKPRVLVCVGTGCLASGALEVLEKLRNTENLSYDIIGTGCHGFCEKGVLLLIPEMHLSYVGVKPEDVAEIVEKTLRRGEILSRLLYVNPSDGRIVVNSSEYPFYTKQKRVVLANCGKINPEDIEESLCALGYQAFREILNSWNPERVCEEILNSELRGRGGGGFVTGQKWAFVKKIFAIKKYVICNGDEGDPGAFMDRSLMEGDPHQIIEGMLIAAYAVGADEGIIYVRAEYPLAIKRLNIAIGQAQEKGFLGKNIFASNFSFSLRVKQGAGAFICGEETALIASIEGKRGTPKLKPPFPAICGLFAKPTLINNVETFANVPSIIRNGAAWFKSIGTPGSSGTKTFALSGEANNTGLIEVPMGTSLRSLVFDIGGGLKKGKKFKAVQIGGPSGGCLPEKYLDTSLDYTSLAQLGFIMGSGGLVVISESTCIVETARFFMEFTQKESCGKCIPCRDGSLVMLNILEDIVNNRATLLDLQQLREIALTVQKGSFCGLGKTAPNPVLSALKYFEEEFLEHVANKHCPAKYCLAFKRLVIDTTKCTGCSLCAKSCPNRAIFGRPGRCYKIDDTICIKCGICVDICKFMAIQELF